jgi:hypothetical protein
MHYSTVIDRFVPIKLVATDFILGDNVQVDDDSSSVSIGAAFGIAPLDGTLIKGGPLQVCFCHLIALRTLSLITFACLSGDQHPSGSNSS